MGGVFSSPPSQTENPTTDSDNHSHPPPAADSRGPSSDASNSTMPSSDLTAAADPAIGAETAPVTSARSEGATEPVVADGSAPSVEVSKGNDDGNPGEGEEEEDEEEGECGFCVYMKGGGCKEAFTDWENCIKEAEDKEEDIVEKCFKVTRALHTCMEANRDYYEPILKAEKDAEEKVNEELAKEGEETKKNEEEADNVQPAAVDSEKKH